MLTRSVMTALALNEAELFVELNRLIYSALDTRRKLLACSVRGGTQAIGFLARNTASALAAAAHELAELVRRLGGAPAQPVAAESSVVPPADVPVGPDLLVTCEQAIAEVACQYRDALEWRLPEAAQEVLMRQFGIVIASYEHIRSLKARLRGPRASKGGRAVAPR
jgi:hypothetical protein